MITAPYGDDSMIFSEWRDQHKQSAELDVVSLETALLWCHCTLAQQILSIRSKSPVGGTEWHFALDLTKDPAQSHWGTRIPYLPYDTDDEGNANCSYKLPDNFAGLVAIQITTPFGQMNQLYVRV